MKSYKTNQAEDRICDNEEMGQERQIQSDNDGNSNMPTKSQFHILIDNSADAILLIDSNGIVKYQSPAYTKMMGRSDYQRIGRECLEFVHPEDHVAFNHAIVKILNYPGLPVKFALRNLHNNGIWRNLECVANNLLGEPNIQSIVVNIQDSTERWHAESALRNSEGLYADLVLNQIAGVYRILIKKPNSNQTIWDTITHEFVSERFCHIIGIEKSMANTLPASIILDSIHPDDRSDFMRSNDEANRTLSPFIWEGRIRTNNITKWVRFDSNPRELEDGSIRWTGVMIEITKQKEVEELLKKNSNGLMRLNDCLSSLGADSDININQLTALCGELLNATSALYNRLGNGILFVAGKWKVPDDYPEVSHTDGRLCYDVIRYKQDKAVVIRHLNETSYARTDPNVLTYGLQTYCGQLVRSEGKPIGSLCVVYDHDFHLSDEDLRIIGIIGSAIGNEDYRKFRSEALSASESKLKDLNATKDKFFSIIAHDLKGPFNGIMGLSEILKDDAQNLDHSTIIEYAEMIYSSALQSHQLLEHLLSWARIQEGKISFNPVPNLLHSMVGEVILLFLDIADHKKITIVNQVPIQTIVVADTEMLKTILRNLISNALKFTNTNGKVKIKATTGDSGVEIVIADSGNGIRAEDIDKLFKVDVAFSTLGTENEKGTGLGLILCKEFVEKHGGHISAESKHGEGSQFKFTLPFNLNCGDR